MTDQEVSKYYRELRELRKEEQKEELLEIKNLLLKRYKKNIQDGDLIEDIGKSGYRTNHVYIISKKNEEIEVLNLGTRYDDYGYVDGDLFSLSPKKKPGYWARASFKNAYWHSEDLPEPISVKYWENPSPDKITSLPSGKSILNIGWTYHLLFPCSKERLLFFLLKAQKKVKALYFIPDYSEPDYFLLGIDTYFMPNDLTEILLGKTPIDKNELEKMLKQQKSQQKKVSSGKKDRPSPSQSATLFQVGSVKKGNDGNMYQVKQNKNKVKRWVKVKQAHQKPAKKQVKKQEKKQDKKQDKKKAPKTKECSPDKILNPATKRCVSKTSKIGKELSKK